jgi:PKD repeat protein
MSARTALTPRLIAGLLSLLMFGGVVGGLFVPGTARADSAPRDPADPTTPATVTADPLPTVQINGVAWAQLVVGNTVYVAGKFTSARPAGVPAGTAETPRKNLLAYDIRTGELITSFAPNLDVQALALAASPDGSRLYVGGDFTYADGQPRSKIAAYDTATGKLVANFRPAVSGTVRAIAATASTVYFGGEVTAVGSTGRNRLAAVSAADGALLPWAPQPGGGPIARPSQSVLAMVLAGPNQLVVAGRFYSLNGVKATGVGALDLTTGATRPFAINSMIANQGLDAAIWSLSSDGTSVFGSAYDFAGVGNMEGTFSAKADGGGINWFAPCRGDVYSTYAFRGAVYAAGHSHDCSSISAFPEQSPRYHQFATAMTTVATQQVVNTSTKFPETPSQVGQPAPSLLGWNPTLYGGNVTGQGQAGWSVTGNADYVVYGGEFPGVNGTDQQGLVRFAVRPVAPAAVAPRASVAFTPTVTMIPGAVRVAWTAVYDRDNENLTYRVYRDSEASAPVCEVVRPSVWWNLPVWACTDVGASAGSHRYLVTATDDAGNRLASSWTTATVGAANSSAVREYAALLARDGVGNHWPLGETAGSLGYDMTGQLDQRVNSGVAKSQAGAVFNDGNGAYSFNGTSNGYLSTTVPVAAPQTFSLEAWFQTTSAKGGKIAGFGNASSGSSSTADRHVFMDTTGKVHLAVRTPAGATATVSTTRALNDGQWHHVTGTMSHRGLSLYVDGALVGTRTDVTRAAQYNGYWRVGGDTVPVGAGANWFTGRVDEVAVYPVALSAEQVAGHVTAGRTGKAPNLRPAASFTATSSALTAYVDATASTDADGTVAGYAWNFGDGATGSGPNTAHSYAAAGTYVVSLTVTDDEGATGTVTRQVTVTPSAVGVGSVAADSFGRTVPAGWGQAERGGPWTVTGNMANASVTSGTGRFTTGAGQALSALLGEVSRTDVALQTAVVVPELPTGGGTYLSLAAQRVGTSDYRAKLWFRSTGEVQVMLVRIVNGAETILGGYVLPGGYKAGDSLTVRFETSGAFPTTLKVKAWATAATEPAEWALTRTDDTAALQRPGGVFIYQYTSASATTATVVRFDDLRAEPAGTVVNRAPTAAFTDSVSGLALTVDGAGSSDADGTVAAHAWDFGDSTTGTGPKASHTYATAGTYTVRLTVTDDDGATGTVTRQVTVTPPPAGVGSVALDTFGRELASGWGTAERGGPWTSGGSGTTSVTGGAGVLTATAGRNASTRLGAVNRTDVALQASVVLPALPTGGGTYLSLATQRVGTSDYRVKLWFRSTGEVQVALERMVDGAETILGDYVLPGGYKAGDSLTVRFETSGSSPTTLKVKTWATGTAEPAQWSLTRTDDTAALQRPGGLFLYQYTSGSATTATNVRIDDLQAEPAGTVLAPAPPPNQAPTASFTDSVSGLALTVDGAGSTDADGTVAAHAWDFGDSTTGTGATTSHTYAAAGTYTVRLTVTDDDGATGTVARQVTVTEPAPAPEPVPQPTALAADAFGRSLTGGWGTADTGGAWTVRDIPADASVADGAGIFAGIKARTTTAQLAAVSAQDVAVQATFTLPRLSTGGGTYVSLGSQQVGTSDYRVKLWFRPTGEVQVMLARYVNNTETLLGGYVLPGGYVAGRALVVRFETSGTGTTTLKVKAWVAGRAEPIDWALVRTDATAALQRPGALFVQQYVSSSATESAVLRVDDLWAGRAGSAPATP